MIRRFYKKTDKWCRVKMFAPDGRFQTDDLVGGLSPQAAEHYAKLQPEHMIIDIFSSKF